MQSPVKKQRTEADVHDISKKDRFSALKKIWIYKEQMKQHEKKELEPEAEAKYHEKQKIQNKNLLLEANIERAKILSILKQGLKTCSF